MTLPTRISFGFMGLLLVLVAAMGLATPLLTVLFSFFLLNVFRWKGRSKDFAVAMLMVTVTAICLGFVLFATRAVVATPEIAGRLIPRLGDVAVKMGFELPFSDLHGLLTLVKGEVAERFGLVGLAGTTLLRQVAFLIIGMVVAISLFHNAAIVIDREKHVLRHNLYSSTADEIANRFELFYRSFHTVMGAQIIISTINTIFTGIFLFAVGFPYWQLLIVVTFLCGLLPILGNIISNTIIVCVGLTVDLQHAMGALGFLVVIHKLEYFLNARIVGSHIRARAAELLLAMLVMEAAFGIPGLIAAPIFYAYLKDELRSRGLV